MVGPEVLARYRLVNHTAHDLATMLPVGKSSDGETVCLVAVMPEGPQTIPFVR